MCRSPRSTDAARAAGLEPIHGDLEEPGALAAALADAAPEVVVHLAARIATTRSAATLARVNTQGTRALADAAVAAGARRMLFASTVVVGEAGGALLTEDSPLPVETPYGRSKQASEQDLLARRDAGSLEVVVLRPSHVYGPGGWFGDIVRDIERGLFRIPGNGENLWDMVHVDDVTSAFVLAAEAAAPGPLYHVVDDVPVTMKAVAAAIATALGRRGPPGHVPVWLARLIRGRNAIDAAVRSARSANARLKAELGWVPTHPSSLASIPEVVRAIVQGPH